MSHVYTKGDYFSQEAQFLRYDENHPVVQAGLIEENARLVDYAGPYFPGTLEGTSPRVRIQALHPRYLRPKHAQRADKILAQYPITSSDNVMVFGAGFGWLCEALIAKTGCTCFGVEPSQYVHDTKALSPDEWLIDGIVAAGLDPALGNGLIVFNDFTDPNPRTTATLDQKDVREVKERKDIRRDRGEVTHIITEEVWQILSAVEQSDYMNAFTTEWPAAQIIHYMDAQVF